jgi:hypothetical protein
MKISMNLEVCCFKMKSNILERVWKRTFFKEIREESIDKHQTFWNFIENQRVNQFKFWEEWIFSLVRKIPFWQINRLWGFKWFCLSCAIITCQKSWEWHAWVSWIIERFKVYLKKFFLKICERKAVDDDNIFWKKKREIV